VKTIVFCSCLIGFAACASSAVADDGPWQSLFDGKSLDGWKAADHDECFKVVDGAIVAGGGPMAHLFYVGPAGGNGGDFKNFELKIDVLTKPGSNGGIFFHTEPQSGFLKKGYEAQIPQGRFGLPEEIADAALWLASDESSYVNGAVIPVDGGAELGDPRSSL